MIENLNILLVEDDDVAAESVIRSFKKMSLDIPITVAENGKEALDIINGENGQPKMASPFIVLLDLNMPIMNGFEFLETVRNNTALQKLVIFILTTSNEDSDRAKAYDHNVAGYMVKSAVGPQFSKLVHLLDSYQNAIELSGA